MYRISTRPVSYEAMGKRTRSRRAACEVEVCLTAAGGALKEAFLSVNILSELSLEEDIECGHELAETTSSILGRSKSDAAVEKA